MSASGGNETALLGSFARKQVKYGSTCKYVSRSGKTIKHIVQPSDTLQGIALRYGVTTEELKRVNRLWTSDSLFLRTWLAVPVLETGPAVAGASVSAGGDTNGGGGAGPEDAPLQPDETIADFLGRIDSSIAQSRNQLRLLSDSSHTGAVCWPHHFGERQGCAVNAAALRYDECSFEATPPSGVAARDSAPAPVVMTRQVKHSLQRHERDHEEIFQL